MPEIEYVQYVDKAGRPTGEIAEKYAAHNNATKTHLAFSCYIFNENGELLVTKRAETKKVWPGVWSNSVCGHVSPNERVEDAVIRRVNYELGIKIYNLVCIKKEYRYITTPFNGVIENEFCPIFVATTKDIVMPNPVEVSDNKWVNFKDYSKALKADSTDAWSWWSKDQYKHIKANPELICRVLAQKPSKMY